MSKREDELKLDTGIARSRATADRSSESDRREMESFLVRVWVEPSEGSSATRGYLRCLRSGEDTYFADPRKLGELILRRMRQERRQGAEVGKVRQLKPR